MEAIQNVLIHHNNAMNTYKNTSHDPNCLIILELNCVALETSEMLMRTLICNGCILRFTNLPLTHPSPSWLSHWQHLVSCQILLLCYVSGLQQKCQWFSFPWWIMSFTHPLLSPECTFCSYPYLLAFLPSFLSSSYPCCFHQTEPQLWFILFSLPESIFSPPTSLNIQNRAIFQSLTQKNFSDFHMVEILSFLSFSLSFFWALGICSGQKAWDLWARNSTKGEWTMNICQIGIRATVKNKIRNVLKMSPF